LAGLRNGDEPLRIALKPHDRARQLIVVWRRDDDFYAAAIVVVHAENVVADHRRALQRRLDDA
jgi:hypothetical protein